MLEAFGHVRDGSQLAAELDPSRNLLDVMLRIGRESDVAKLTPNGCSEHFGAEVEEERRAVKAQFLGESQRAEVSRSGTWQANTDS